MIIYKITDLTNGKIYIGQDKHNRLNYLGSGLLINRAIKSHDVENFVKETMAHCYTQEHLNFLEKFYIKFCNSKAPIGYNLTDGGYGGLGWPKGKKHSIECRKRMSEGGKGKILTEEHRRNIGKGSKGRVKSKQEIENISKSLIGHKVSKKLIDIMKNNNPMKNPKVAKKVSETRIKNGIAKGNKNPMFGRRGWNKGLTKETDERVRNNYLYLSKKENL